MKISVCILLSITFDLQDKYHQIMEIVKKYRSIIQFHRPPLQGQSRHFLRYPMRLLRHHLTIQ